MAPAGVATVKERLEVRMRAVIRENFLGCIISIPEIIIDNMGGEDGHIGGSDGIGAGVTEVFGGDLSSNSGTRLKSGRVTGHSKAFPGVILGDKGVVFGKGEEVFGIVFGDTGDTGEVASGGIVGEIREFSLAFFDVGGDGVGLAIIGTKLGKNALVFDITLVVFVFGIPIRVFCAVIDALCAGSPFEVGEVLSSVDKIKNVADDWDCSNDGAAGIA